MRWPNVAWGLARISSRELTEWSLYFGLLADEAEAAHAGLSLEEWEAGRPDCAPVEIGEDEDIEDIEDAPSDHDDMSDEELAALVEAEQRRIAALKGE